MNKIDENILIKAKDIADDTLSVMRGEKGEKKALDQALVNNAFMEEYVGKLSDPKTVEDICGNYHRPERDAQVEKLKIAIKRQRLIVRRRRIVAITSSVAAAMLFISFLVFRDNEPILVERDEMLIGEVAKDSLVLMPTIIFGSGERVEIDRGKNSIRTTDYSAIVKATKINTKQQKSTDVEYCTFVVPRQFVCDVELPDGTIVKMNSGGRLKYPKQFDGQIREVELEGEAYFVVKKSEIPFRVKVGGMEVSVLGTEFNINQKEKSIQTLLVNGSVEIVIDKKEVIMKPNQLYNLDTERGEGELTNVELDNYLSWMGDSFSYKDVTLQYLLERLSSWYGVRFKLYNKSICSIKIDIQVDKYENIEDVLHILEHTIGIRTSKNSMGFYVVK